MGSQTVQNRRTATLNKAQERISSLREILHTLEYLSEPAQGWNWSDVGDLVQLGEQALEALETGQNLLNHTLRKLGRPVDQAPPKPREDDRQCTVGKMPDVYCSRAGNSMLHIIDRRGPNQQADRDVEAIDRGTLLTGRVGKLNVYRRLLKVRNGVVDLDTWTYWPNAEIGVVKDSVLLKADLVITGTVEAG